MRQSPRMGTGKNLDLLKLLKRYDSASGDRGANGEREAIILNKYSQGRIGIVSFEFITVRSSYFNLNIKRT